MPAKPTEYIAIKLRGFNHLLWFERAKTTEEAGCFKGIEGWGESGAFTNVECESQCIEARLESEMLQYGE